MSVKERSHYSIRDLADEFDITTRTIRFYEAEGLLSPQREGQTRIYSPQDRVRLKLILRGKRLGLSLAESRELIDMYDPSANRPQLESLLSAIDRRRQQLSDLIGGRAGLGEAGHGNAGVERGQCVHRNSCVRTVTRRGLYGKARSLSLPSGDQSFFLTHNWVSSGQTS